MELHLDGRTETLDREDARSLRDALDDALTERRAFVHTACRRRAGGEYVVERRNGDSAGQRKVFEDHETLRALYESLPETFSAADLDWPGLSGSRRHLLVWHLVEHPAFDCELAGRQPLTARKTTDGRRPETD